jgi:hypothetical protein
MLAYCNDKPTREPISRLFAEEVVNSAKEQNQRRLEHSPRDGHEHRRDYAREDDRESIHDGVGEQLHEPYGRLQHEPQLGWIQLREQQDVSNRIQL